MTIKSDSVIVENGIDFTFVCHKVPFAISCSSELPHGDTNLIDLDLVNRMRIPLRNIRVTRMSLLGHDVRAVGRIKQTVQCVRNGRVQGTVHLEAKVVRDLYSLLEADCVASSKTYERLVGRKPPEPPDEGYDSPEEVPNLDDVENDAKEEVKDDEDENKNGEATKMNEKSTKEEPPDPNLTPHLRNLDAECAKNGFNDLDDFVRNAPWSGQCVPRVSANAEDELHAAAYGYPDTRYDLEQLPPLGPTDLQIIASMQEDQDDEEDDQYHASFGVTDHAPHFYSMRNQPVDLDEYAARHGHYNLQLRGPRGRRRENEDEDDEYSADQLAALHGYPPGRPGRQGRARRM